MDIDGLHMGLRIGALRVVFFAALAVAPFAAAQAQTDQQLIVDRATKTVGDLTHDKAFGNTHQLLGRMMRDTTDAR
jgi:hypothetical protein